MMLVVLWHGASLYILEATLLWGSSSGEGAEAMNNTATTTGASPWWERAEHHQLHHHPGWTPFVSDMVIRYWLRTEKVAVPGFCFLSGYFSKNFLAKQHLLRDSCLDQGESDSERLLQEIRRDQQKDQLRWKKTISTLLVGPLLWQVLAWVISCLAKSLYESQLDVTLHAKLDLWDYLGTWYLFSLLMWRIWTTVFLSRIRQDKRWLPLLISMVLSLVSVHTNRGGPQEMRMRLFYFFPYYVGGLYCDETVWHRLIIWFRRFFICRRKADGLSYQVSLNELDRAGRTIGCCGIILTLWICQVIPRDHLAWIYSIDNYYWLPHLIFGLQYIGAGTAVAAIILVVKTIPFPILPFGHSNSTLAIYEVHWPFANFIAWGNLPYTGITVTWLSLVQYCFSRLPPLPAVIAVHLVCYGICVVLGNRILWEKTVRHVCDPEWASNWFLTENKIGQLLPL